MKTNRSFTTAALGISLAALVLNGCKKESTQPSTDSDITAAQDEANANFVIQDTKTISDGAANQQSVERMQNGGCAQRRSVFDTTYNSKQDSCRIISFPGNCVSPDGRTRKGDIFVFWSNGKRYFDSGCVVTEVFSSAQPYSVTLLNGFTVQVIGTRQATNMGRDTGNADMNWNFTASLQLVYSNNAGTATWNSTRQYSLSKQGNSGYFYSVTGGANGTTRNGVNFSISILQPLWHTAYWLNTMMSYPTCDCFEAGEVEISRTGHPYSLYLTFTGGIGNCSRTATATINNRSYNIVLP